MLTNILFRCMYFNRCLTSLADKISVNLIFHSSPIILRTDTIITGPKEVLLGLFFMGLFFFIGHEAVMS